MYPEVSRPALVDGISGDTPDLLRRVTGRECRPKDEETFSAKTKNSRNVIWPNTITYSGDSSSIRRPPTVTPCGFRLSPCQTIAPDESDTRGSPGERVMEARYQVAFYQAADEHQCWIGVREPNLFARRWIGKSDCAPKPKYCEAKTADNPAHRLAGLVVNPHTAGKAFGDQSVVQAKATWDQWIAKRGGRLPPGFRETDGGEEMGLVRLYGYALYSDFDLMAVDNCNDRGERFFTSRSEQRAAYVKVRRSVNRSLGIPMIQHGPEFDYPRVGARSSERVWWFGPGRRLEVGSSSMPAKANSH